MYGRMHVDVDFHIILTYSKIFSMRAQCNNAFISNAQKQMHIINS